MKKAFVVGIDAGSAAVSAVALDEDGSVLASLYDFHKGKTSSCIQDLLSRLLPRDATVLGLARSTTTPEISLPSGEALAVDGRIAEIEALRRLHPGTRTLLAVGAERFARIGFDSDGSYRRMRGNSSCAAGTGSFLDLQATRLGLAGGSAELAARAALNSGDYPSIASRCSVFAKTDLIHAQAEGWSVEAICEGLCHGLARNIADTLFPGESPDAPILMTGGVSRNAAVLRHLSVLAGSAIETDGHGHLYGAIGACLRLMEQGAWSPLPFAAGEIRVSEPGAREYANGGLEAPGPGYPDFSSLSRYLFEARKNGPSNPVEVDIYLEPGSGDSGAAQKALLGFDVGSTSTKAALLGGDGEIMAGFYTRTAGRPLEAAQSILEAIEDFELRCGAKFEVCLASTTGSGRALVGAVIGADATIDEITAHARAAVELDPEVDTIIEIGGQDSKFTVLKDGIVTFSQMNAICAAGTGSFLEEQAERLGVPLLDFSERALGSPSPLTSDRCTVFMERDLNQFQACGYSTEELLAASLFSVCDNYLGRVAREASIGTHITFQGATAKNRALVAAFERRLGQRIRVSRYCHLTGAIGAALQARDELAAGSEPAAALVASRFRGLSLHRLDLGSRSERCGLCANDCRLRIVEVGGEDLAFGFLCGRDYATKRRVDRSRGGELLRLRSKAIASAYAQARAGCATRLGYPTIGIPSSLFMAEDAPFWASFFQILGFPVLHAPDDAETLRRGKRLAGAEFCAPMAMFHGQVSALLTGADLAFLPVYLEERPARPAGAEAFGEGRRYYCNYSQYASVVARCAEGRDRARIVSPLIRGRHGVASMALDEIRGALKVALLPWGLKPPSDVDCESAYAACLAARERASLERKRLFAERLAGPEKGGDVGVVLVGRLYAVLSEAMGASIGDMLAKRGINVAYSDMLPEPDASDIEPLLAAFHWRYAAEVLEAAEFCAKDSRFYPVLVTTFKCSPDSFALEWFRRILDRAGKPYLVLQIDEHDSGLGYETRVEAAIRSFRNHRRRALAGGAAAGPRPGASKPLLPAAARDLRGKTLLIPNWDPLVCPLLAANLRGCGIDVRCLEESPTAIRRAMRWNSGQCIPINIVARECVDLVEREGLDPSRVVLLMLSTMWPCNIPMYPHFIKALVDASGRGMEALQVYPGDVTFMYLGAKAMIGAYHAYLAGGTLRRLACRTRPYELDKGATRALVDRAMELLTSGFETNRGKEALYREVFEPFGRLAIGPRDRPKVAIFGDFYARDNEVLNQGLEAKIEEAGGEAVTTPYIDYIKAILDSIFKRLLIDRSYAGWAKMKAALLVVAAVEKSLALRDHVTFGRPSSWRNPSFLEKLALLGMRPENEGECFDNAIKIFRALEEQPDISFFVQAIPAFCCPSIITEAMSRQLEALTGVPIVTLTYDGTGTPKNDAIIPYLAFGRGAREPSVGSHH